MAVPQVVIDVGFSGPSLGTELIIGDTTRGLLDTGTLGLDDAWTDITDYARNWSYRRGANRGNDLNLRYEAGTCTIELNNADRRFDPLNLDGPYVVAGESQVVPMVRVRIRAVWDGDTYPLFTGYADQWQINYQGTSWATVVLTATDASKVFASYDRSAQLAVGAGEDSGARIDRILDAIDWPDEDRIIATGDTSVQATTLEGNVLSELQLVQDTELGEFYVNASGKVVFRNRRAILSDPMAAVSQGLFGDGGFTRPILYDFELDAATTTGIAGYYGQDCTVAASAAQAHSGSQSMLITTVGTPTTAYARQVTDAPVVADRRYMVGFWCYSPTSRFIGAAIDWDDANGNYLTTDFDGLTVAATTWTYVSCTGTAPPTAAGAHFGPTITSSPPAGTQLYVDELSFVDLDNELPYADVTVETDDTGMANLVTVTRAGGSTEVYAEDPESRQKYLTKTYSRTDLLLLTDLEALDYAEALIYQSSRPELRFGQLILNNPQPQVEALLWPQMLGRDFGDRITVIRRPVGGGDPIERDVFVRGIEASSDGPAWRTAFVLQDAAKFSFFVVGDPVYGVLDSNALGF